MMCKIKVSNSINQYREYNHGYIDIEIVGGCLRLEEGDSIIYDEYELYAYTAGKEFKFSAKYSVITEIVI